MAEVVQLKATLPAGFFGPGGAEKLRAAETDMISEAASLIQYFARQKAPRNHGILVNSIQRSVDVSGQSVVGRVFSPLPHAIVVEYGRIAPGKFPPDDKDADPNDETARPIASWLISKGIANQDDKDFEARVFMVRRSIAQVGFKGHPHPTGFSFLRGAVQEAIPRLEDIWRAAIARQGGAA